MATVTVRRLDPVTREPVYGGGQDNFISDIDAVAQILATRLRLFQGEWWENLADGTPLFQSVLGVGEGSKGLAAAAAVIQDRILGTQYVTGITDLVVTFTGSARVLTFSCSVYTQFGTLTLSSQPGLAAAVGVS